jgi:hypothetical protein
VLSDDDEELEVEFAAFVAELLAAVFVLFRVFTADRVLAFRVDVRTVDLVATEVLVVVDAVADLTTCVFPVATSAAIRAVEAVAMAAVQRVMRVTRRRPVVRILVSRVCRSVVMETMRPGRSGKQRRGSCESPESRSRARRVGPGYPVRRIAPYA